ncbi:hypothetical protein DFH06DRAFT_1470800 [Mycena polygramma]|nr:hypothetical protein DFH06DRAFT_1470800 [Mycena polygramma]
MPSKESSSMTCFGGRGTKGKNPTCVRAKSEPDSDDADRHTRLRTQVYAPPTHPSSNVLKQLVQDVDPDETPLPRSSNEALQELAILLGSSIHPRSPTWPLADTLPTCRKGPTFWLFFPSGFIPFCVSALELTTVSAIATGLRVTEFVRVGSAFFFRMSGGLAEIFGEAVGGETPIGRGAVTASDSVFDDDVPVQAPLPPFLPWCLIPKIEALLPAECLGVQLAFAESLSVKWAALVAPASASLLIGGLPLDEKLDRRWALHT